MESSLPGHLPTFSERFSNTPATCSSIFVDHATHKTYVEHQISTSATETLEAKSNFEKLAADFNVQIKSYRADNGPFKSDLIRTYSQLKNQTITYSGVGVHRQNGVAERHIRTISEKAQSMLLHAIIRWPDIITFDLWPFAVSMAVDIHNNTPHKDNNYHTPNEAFANMDIDTTFQRTRLNCFHTFGCPVFILDKVVQDGNKPPCWVPRSHPGVYLGHSTHHTANVAWVMNIKTHHISPQYHIVFDEGFTTVGTQNTMCMPHNWQELYEQTKKNFLLEEDVEILQDPSKHTMQEEWIHSNVSPPPQYTDGGFKSHKDLLIE